MTGRDLQQAADTHWWETALTRIIWLVFVFLTLALFAVGIPAAFRQLQTVCVSSLDCTPFQLSSADALALYGLGLSLRFYAAGASALTLFVLLTFYVAAAVLFWRKASTRMTLFLSFYFVLLGPPLFSNVTGALVHMDPRWRFPAGLLTALGVWFSFVAYYLFPDGRFVPRWTRSLAVVIATYALVSSFLISQLTVFISGTSVDSLRTLIWTGWFAAGAAAQVYRYRRVSGPIEKQQTKWVVFGLAANALNIIVLYALSILFPSVRQPGLPHLLRFIVGGSLNALFLVLQTIFIAIAVLRYRLWDIDFIIRKTVIYALLTGNLIAVYFISIVLLQELFQFVTGQAGSPVATVISTLGMAALFTPLRKRIQNDIDQRFYRQKYNAEQALVQFAINARDEVDQDRLTAALLGVIEMTLQPQTVWLWLRPTGKAFSALPGIRKG
jgi:hypothetical protein